MDAACNQDFLNKGCVCLSDPLDPWSNICAMIDRQNGLVYPCNWGCCNPRCENQGQSQNLNMELHRTGGVSLPSGFGQALASGGGGGATGPNAPSVPITTNPVKIRTTQATDWGGAQPPKATMKVWQIVLILLVFLVIIFLVTGTLD